MTQDGYNLTLFRINSPTTRAGAPVVFFQHGLTSSADTWIMSKELSPAFRAAQAGYDVWLGNNRGNKYSRKHVAFKPVDDFEEEFFDYSFYELGQFDATASIDYVLNHTGKAKLSWIGHSQGTSQMFSALSEGHGNLQNKINLFVAISPITNLNLAKAPFGTTDETVIDVLSGLANVLGVNELMGPKW